MNQHAPITLQHGDYIRIDLSPLPGATVPTRVIARCLRDGIPYRSIRRVYEEADTDFEWETVPQADDTTAMLQLYNSIGTARRLTAGAVAQAQRPCIQLCLDKSIPRPPEVLVDFSTVIWAREALHHIHLGLMEQLPADLDLPDETIWALQGLQQSTMQPVLKVSFYVDGSKVAQGSVGAGIVCICETHDSRFLAGCMSKRVDKARHAFEGEHAAMTWALIWAIHISSGHQDHYPGQSINFSFNFDAMNTGNQASGKWRTQAHQQWKTMMRSLVHILQHRHTHHGIHWEHIKAHTNHPYNEFADRLAKLASQHPEEVDGCDTWQQWMADENHLSALQWIWFLEHCQNADARDVPELDGHLLRHQLIVPASCSLPQTTDNPPPQPCSTIDISFVIATANVLTLAEGPQRATPQLIRQQLLMEQFHTARCHIVALQETRHKRLIDRGNEF